MRSPIVTVTVLAAAILSPALTHAAPVTFSHRSLSNSGNERGNTVLTERSLEGLGFSESLSKREPTRSKSYSSSGWTMNPKKFWKKAVVNYTIISKRVDDTQTMGGNAHSGSSGDVEGGTVNNTDTTNNQGMPVLMNMNSNNAGIGGKSKSGCVASGKSSSRGIGGNSSSGDSGEAYGGDVNGPPSGMMNINSNNAGGAGDSETGCAIGGNSNEAQPSTAGVTPSG